MSLCEDRSAPDAIQSQDSTYVPLSLSVIPTEVLRLIFDSLRFLPTDSSSADWLYFGSDWTPEDIENRQALHALCLVNRRIGSIATESLYSTLSSEDLRRMLESRVHIDVRPDLLKHTRDLHINDFSLPALSLCPSLRAIRIDCSCFATAALSELLHNSQSIQSRLGELRYVVAEFGPSQSSLLSALLQALSVTDRLYDGIRLLQPDFSSDTPLCRPIRVKTLSIESDRGGTPPSNFDLSSIFDSTNVVHLHLELSLTVPGDFVERLFDNSWSFLEQLALVKLRFEGYTGFGLMADRAPSLRTLELQELSRSSDSVARRRPDDFSSDRRPITELILATLPASIQYLGLSGVSVEDPVGIDAVLRSLRNATRSLRHLTAIRFEFPAISDSNGREASFDAEEYVQVAGQLEIEARKAGIEIIPQNLLEEVKQYIARVKGA